MRDVIRRRSTNWWKRKKKKRKESRAGITASCRLQLAFHVGGAASCAGPSLSRQTHARQQTHFYLYAGCNANERGDTPP